MPLMALTGARMQTLQDVINTRGFVLLLQPN